MPASLARVHAAPSPLAYARDVVSLAKPRLSTLVVCTTAGGMWLAPTRPGAFRAAMTLACTTLVVGAANALNNYLERDVDAHMRRTRNRPLPAGRLEPAVALALGLGLPALAIPALVLAAGPLTGVARARRARQLRRRLHADEAAQHPRSLRRRGPRRHPAAHGLDRRDGPDRPGRPGALRHPLLLAAPPLPRDLHLPRGGLRPRRPPGLRARPRRARCPALRPWRRASCSSRRPSRSSCSASPGPLTAWPRRRSGRASVAGRSRGSGFPQGSTRWARNFFLATLAYLTLLFIALFLWAR